MASLRRGQNRGEALQRVKNNQPDLILLDFQMPDLNGIDVARKSHISTPTSPSDGHDSPLQTAGEEARKVGIRGACAKSDVARSWRPSTHCCITKPISQQ